MSFTYNTAVPAANDNPSNDQPDMLTNTQSINSIWAIDHVTFQGNPAGTHLQTTFSSKNTPGAQTDPQSILYTASGTASTVADLRFVNQNATFPISFVRAWASCTQAGISGAQSFNVTSVTRTGLGLYDVILPANVTTGTNYGVIGAANFGASPNAGIWFTYTITAATTFSIKMLSQGAVEPTAFNFIVIQL